MYRPSAFLQRLLHPALPHVQTVARVEAGEAVRFRANWGVEVTCSKRFLREMKDHRIDIEKPLDVQCPMRIIHAMEVRERMRNGETTEEERRVKER